METPVEIEFVGMASLEGVQQEIDRYIAGLEKRFGRITSCRVVVRAPGNHHQNGDRYEVKIQLALPDHKEVNVAHLPKDDGRSVDVRSAVNDAFKRARRQLTDRVRRMEGRIKHHEAELAMPPIMVSRPAPHLLDLNDAAVRKMIKVAEKRGFVTYEELNGLLPSDASSSPAIEDVLGQLSEMGINVIEERERPEEQRG